MCNYTNYCNYYDDQQWCTETEMGSQSSAVEYNCRESPPLNNYGFIKKII